MSKEMTLVEEVVRFAIELKYEDIPPEDLDIARWLVFDSLGTGLGGYQQQLGQKTAVFACSRPAVNEATVLGNGARISSEDAAFANGTMIKILGMDDSHRSASHIASQVIPAALAVAEAHQTTGRKLLTAIVAAYDLAVRVGCAVRFEQRRRGLDIKGTVGVMAAALAAGLCANLDEATLVQAVALAADLSSGTEQYVYEGGQCDTKDLIAGFAARNGVFAVNLAKSGFYGPRGALDGEYGFFRAFGDGYDGDIFADLGEHFAILTTAFKPHGGCRHTHQAVDAVQVILRDGELDPTQIEKVEVQTYAYALKPHFRINPDPPARDVAGLSIRVATALALVRGSTWPDDYQHWDEPEVQRLRRLVRLSIEPEIEGNYPDQNGCRVIVTLADGSVREGYVPFAKGEPEFRISPDDLRQKFHMLTHGILTNEEAQEIYRVCAQLEDADDVSYLMKLTTAEMTRMAG